MIELVKQLGYYYEPRGEFGVITQTRAIGIHIYRYYSYAETSDWIFCYTYRSIFNE